LGNPVDDLCDIATVEYAPIHKEPPVMTRLVSAKEVFETGIKA
jgi:F0F1-type ATP synthase beta subunit